MQLSLQLSKLQGTTSYFNENVGRVGVKSDTVGGSVMYQPYKTLYLASLHLTSRKTATSQSGSQT